MKKIVVALFSLLVVIPGPALASWNADWSQRHKITLEAQNLRGVTEEVKRAPVLVRLHSGVLDFSQVRPDGADLRFVAGDDKTPLTYHIERFDPTAELGLVWVDVPSTPAGKSQDIWLYFGNPAAKPVSNPAATYDGEQSLVYHFGETAGGPVDQTANGNKPSLFTAAPTLEGLSAGGATFQATSQMRVGPSASLAVAAGGRMTFSAWIKPAAEGQPSDAAVYSKFGVAGEGGSDRLVLGLRNGVPYVRVAGAATGEAIAAAAVSPGSWTHLAVTAGDKITLYVNGVAAGSIDAKLPALGGEDVVGAAGGLPSFVGDLDEVGRANTVRSASAIALAAQSQGRSAVFTAFAPEAESTKGGEASYFGILLKALTLDAWVVIIILLLMAALSWVVMIGKGLFLNRTASANHDFLDDFSEAMARQGAHDGLARLDIDRHADSSSLARLFHIGRRELQVRLTENGATGRGVTSFALAPQSIAAIRSALDAGQARESQKLNSFMVLLTIAISGGPFIGLLGTVLGVMITFAAVAAAGDVNINAIAPGIAAALLATVAGLAVAIPALFGYNYLLSRSDEIGVEQQIFVDELEKRIAETYRGAPLPLAAE